MARRRCQHRGEGEAVVLAQFAAREVEVRNAGLDQKTGNQDGSRAAYLSPVPLCVRLSFVMSSGSRTVVVGGVDSSVLVVADRAMRVVLHHDDAAVRVVDAALPDEMLGRATRCRCSRRRPRGGGGEKTRAFDVLFNFISRPPPYCACLESTGPSSPTPASSQKRASAEPRGSRTWLKRNAHACRYARCEAYECSW